MKTNTLILLCIFLALSCFVSLTRQECIHDQLDHQIQEIPEEEADPEGAGSGRLLAAATWAGIRIRADFSHFRGTASTKSYIQKKLLPAAFDYFKATLKVKKVSKLRTSSSSLCGLSVPSVYRSGVAADLVLFVTSENSPSSWVAWATPCLSLSGNGRAIFGQINFNTKFVSASSSRPFDDNLMTTMHEMTHVLGFSQSLFGKFLHKPRMGTKNLNGRTTSYIDIAPLTAKVRSHFNCKSAVAFLENQGGSGSAGSHFERRTFANEYMTASAVPDLRITKFTLALLEGSGWYKVNYAKADRFHWGQGDGCNQVFGQCFAKAFSEYCSVNGASGCTFHRTHGAYCNSGDSFADGCRYQRAYSNHDCSNPSDSGRRALAGEYFGTGSRCFTGTLYNGGALRSKRPYCLKYTCVKAGKGYDIKVSLGSRTATCKNAGSISISGYSGRLDCPNPNTFCVREGVKYCKKGCLGRGTCSSGKCKCKAGYTGSYCQSKTSNIMSAVEVLAPKFDPAVDVVHPTDPNVEEDFEEYPEEGEVNVDDVDNWDEDNYEDEPAFADDDEYQPDEDEFNEDEPIVDENDADEAGQDENNGDEDNVDEEIVDENADKQTLNSTDLMKKPNKH